MKTYLLIVGVHVYL